MKKKPQPTFEEIEIPDYVKTGGVRFFKKEEKGVSSLVISLPSGQNVIFEIKSKPPKLKSI